MKLPAGDTAPHRVQLRRTKGWRKPVDTVVVARPTKWGNPFRVSPGESPHTWVEAYARWLRQQPAGIAIAAAARRELRGKNLACWCRLDQPCHADVLLAVANAPQSPRGNETTSTLRPPALSSRVQAAERFTRPDR